MSDIEINVKDSRLAKFFKGVRTEFRKIIWPERDTLLKQLLAVVVSCVIIGLLIALFDFAAQNLTNIFVNLGA